MKQLPLISERRVHIAIMRKSWGLLEKILSGEKTIESRWYLKRSAPWNEIDEGDIIYFKNSGEPITLQAEVGRVLQFANLTPVKVRDILSKFGRRDGLDVGELGQYFELFKNKRYCLLIFLKNVRIIEPFQIEKSGFGAMSAWIVIDNIEKIKKIHDPIFRQISLLGK